MPSRSNPAASPRRRRSLALALLCTAGIGGPLTAQCTTPWLPGAGLPGTDGHVHTSIEWDPDGAGPQPARLVVGGLFTLCGNTAANNIAWLDPVSGLWNALGSGTNQTVRALAVMPNGDLIAGGQFTVAGGGPAYHIARWNGTQWAPLTFGTNGWVMSLAVMPNGDLVVGGYFTTDNPGNPYPRILRWNGTTLSGLGAGMSGGVLALTVRANGDLVAGGVFATAGGVTVNGIARWNGSVWSPLGGGLGTPATVNALLTLPNGDLVAGGQFTVPGVFAYNVARWDGSAWSSFGGSGMGTAGIVYGLARMPNGDLIAVGYFTWPGNAVARWNGATWSAVGSGVFTTAFTATARTSGELVVGGPFTTGNGFNAQHLARWNGAAWSAFGQSSTFGHLVLALAAMPNGDVAAGGYFQSVGGVTMNGIARRTGTVWTALGSGTVREFSTSAGFVFATLPLPNGDLVIGGQFGGAGGISSRNIARWNGISWSGYGAGLPAAAGTSLSVTALARRPNGDLIAGLSHGGGGNPPDLVYRWTGAAWAAIGTAVIGTRINAFATLPNGDLVAGGSFTSISGVPAPWLARWNGTTWSQFGGGFDNEVTSLTVLPNGDLVAGGWFTSPGSRVARWNGTTWSPLGAGVNDAVNAVAALPDGSVVAGGRFTLAGGVAASRIARWNGSAWSPFGAGVSAPFSEVMALAALPSGNVAVGGTFLVAGGTPAAYFAEITTTCPAAATPSGSGCAGPAGTPALSAEVLPWLGGTCRTRAVNLPANSLGLAVTGFGPASLPLSAVHPSAGPGCMLLASPDAIDVLVPVANAATWSLAIPPSLALVGAQLWQQVVPIVIDTTPQIAGLWASNSLLLTAGVF